ncbi:MAG: hypothetical protein JST79_05400 [Acidobacteria bacterium]|nr:hypothetical protein [Acidobacteriota bacterium]
MKSLITLLTAVLLIGTAFAADDVASAIHGTVEKIDNTSKTVAVKTADGSVHTLHLAKSTTVHGAKATADATAAAGKASWHGIDTGSEVIVHYTKTGTEKSAVEIDRIGKGGFDVTKGTVESISRGGKSIAVKTSDGTIKTFHLTDRAAKYVGTETGKGAEKGSQVTVYSTETAGKKMAHFFEKI